MRCGYAGSNHGELDVTRRPIPGWYLSCHVSPGQGDVQRFSCNGLRHFVLRILGYPNPNILADHQPFRPWAEAVE